ncbi:hypothetical protein [Hyphomicrobium sp. LHD-15]|uniref:hypothetical protein n=1 Tax=Hyphomicrobium sp. LHD-15 TaxID=3072142 RepID=UPI00280CC0EF|nr:hypothetical protein [Hyphomicrobium sp. LHD-15]MDQ8698119.1 hypothetical protein [Hyphomicrobium sp. LHD-15]
MSAAAASDVSEEQFLASVAEVCAVEPLVSQIGAAILVAIDLGIAHDSRTFSRIFGVAHALVLREITELSTGDGAVLKTMSRNDRTQRTELALTDSARQLLGRARKPTTSQA